MLRRTALWLVLLAAAAVPLGAQTPGGSQCNLASSQQIDQSSAIITITGAFTVTCEDGAELHANAGTLNRTTREVYLSGGVSFHDPQRNLTSDQATYSASIGRLYATGHVVFTSVEQGMTLKGPELEYFRAMEGRPQPQANAAQRPHLTLVPRSNGKENQPLDVDADRMTIVGDNDLSAFGNVVVVRPDMRATAEQGRYNGTTESMELRENARVTSKEYTLTGAVVQAEMPQGQLSRVEARTDATLTGKDLQVQAPDLRIFFTDGQLTRTVARMDSAAAKTAARARADSTVAKTTAQPVATSKTFRLQADSMEAQMPGQQLDKVIAIGNARGVSIDTARADTARTVRVRGDTVRADSARADTAHAAPATPAARDSARARALAEARARPLLANDWIVGDTIIGYFEKADSGHTARPHARGGAAQAADSAARDTASVVVKRIVARGAAQSLYHVDQKGSGGKGAGAGGINFLAGKEIELTFEGGELQVANVTGLEKGIYLEPNSTQEAPASAPADTTATPGTPAPPAASGSREVAGGER
ncbi:MAG TPA: LptA/OstA family protein [Longimicrobiaceae bacterium]|nr:LptA/OstA family protein [Longimicrobiaceae bacterium]